MIIVADIQLAFTVGVDRKRILFERLTYDPATGSATSEIYEGPGSAEHGEKHHLVRKGYPLRNVDCDRFLETIGNDNKAGRLLDVYIKEEC